MSFLFVRLRLGFDLPVGVPARRCSGTPIVLAPLGVLLLLLACSEPPVPHLHNPGTTIVCLGDSITFGTGAAPGESYPAVLEAELGVPVVALGVPGDTAEQGLARLDDALERDPWLVIVGLGGNDLLRRVPAERTEAALEEIVTRILAAGRTPLLIELDAPFDRTIARAQGRVAAEHGVPMVEDVLGRILRDPDLKSDTIHPNAAGYRLLGEAVAAEVRPLLEARRTGGSP